jgi:hypothetical protein
MAARGTSGSRAAMAASEAQAWVMKLPLLNDSDRRTLLNWGGTRYTHFRVFDGADHCEVGGFFRGTIPPLKKVQSLLVTNLKGWKIARRDNREPGWLVLASADDARERLGLNQEAMRYAEEVARQEAEQTFERQRQECERKWWAREMQRAKACMILRGLVRTRVRTCFEVLAADVKKRQREAAARQAAIDEEVIARRHAKKRKFHVESHGHDTDEVGVWERRYTNEEADMCDNWRAVKRRRAGWKTEDFLVFLPQKQEVIL